MRNVLFLPAWILFLFGPTSCVPNLDDPSEGPPVQPVDDAPMVWPMDDRPLGAACAFDTQCSSRRCSADVDAGACGECVTIEPLGAPCNGLQQGCSISAECVNGHCRSTRKAEGEWCALGAKGYDIGECDIDLACVSDDSLDFGICVRRARVGESCADAPAGCVRDAYCDQNNVCTVRDCLHGRVCHRGTVCDSAGSCQPGTVSEGEPCSIDGSDACLPGLVCLRFELADGVAHTCSQPLGDGEPCSHEDCAEGLFCWRPEIGGPAWCDTPRDEGEACDNSFYQRTACAVPLECRGETCKVACQ